VTVRPNSTQVDARAGRDSGALGQETPLFVLDRADGGGADRPAASASTRSQGAPEREQTHYRLVRIDVTAGGD
jgi:hypothetical protein